MRRGRVIAWANAIEKGAIEAKRVMLIAQNGKTGYWQFALASRADQIWLQDYEELRYKVELGGHIASLAQKRVQ